MANGVDHKCSLARIPKEERKPQARTISTRSRHNARHSPLVRTTRWRSNCEADRGPVIGRYTSVSNFLRKPQTKIARSEETARSRPRCQSHAKMANSWSEGVCLTNTYPRLTIWVPVGSMATRTCAMGCWLIHKRGHILG